MYSTNQFIISSNSKRSSLVCFGAMSSLLLVAFLLSSYPVVSVHSLCPIAGGAETIWSARAGATAATEADGGRRGYRSRGGGAVARYLVVERSVMGMVPSRREPVMRRPGVDREPTRRPWTPPSPVANKAVASGMPPCLGDGCAQIQG